MGEKPKEYIQDIHSRVGVGDEQSQRDMLKNQTPKSMMGKGQSKSVGHSSIKAKGSEKDKSKELK